MKTEIPTCPSCKKPYTLIFVSANEAPAPRFRCSPDAGGCGMIFYVGDLPRLYVAKEGQG